MKLYHSPRSPFVRKVMVAAYELGIADKIEIVPTIVMMGAPNQSLFDLNPLSKIPTLELDDGTVIYDSLQIIEYFDKDHKLIPLHNRQTELTQHALGNGMLDMLVLWRNERDKPLEKQFQPWIDGFTQKTHHGLAAIERLINDEFILSQITFACVLAYLDFRFSEIDWRKSDRLKNWYQTVSSRTSMKKTEITPL